MKLYKVLVNGESCHGGKYKWSLPTVTDVPGTVSVWTPGNWEACSDKIILCTNGFHVTEKPGLWWKDGCTVYEVEVDGDLGGKDDTRSKLVYPRVRLLHRVSVVRIGDNWSITQDEAKSSGWADPVKDSTK